MNLTTTFVVAIFASLLVGLSLSQNLDQFGCYWSGTSPFCDGSCRTGEFVAKSSRTGGEGEATCLIGKKRYCCKHDGSYIGTTDKPDTVETLDSNGCYWSGTSPFCQGSCRTGEYVKESSTTGGVGDATCLTGIKRHCCKIGWTPLFNSSSTSSSGTPA